MIEFRQGYGSTTAYIYIVLGHVVRLLPGRALSANTDEGDEELDIYMIHDDSCIIMYTKDHN